MAKAKKDKKDKGAKAKKDKAGKPKAASAAKVTKGLKMAGKAAMKLAEQPAVSEAVAAAMLSAAAALREPAKKQSAKGGGGGSGSADMAEAWRQAGALGDALRALAIDVARRTVDGWEESLKRPKGKGSGKA